MSETTALLVQAVVAVLIPVVTTIITLMLWSYKRGESEADIKARISVLEMNRERAADKQLMEQRLNVMQAQLDRIESKIDDLPCHEVACPGGTVTR